MVLWVRRHNEVLAGPNGSLQAAFNSLAAEVQEGQAAPESAQGSAALPCPSLLLCQFRYVETPQTDLLRLAHGVALWN